MKRIVLILFFFVVFSGSARAQFFIEEGKVNLVVSGGERINKSVMIDNTSADEMTVRVYWEDFQYAPPYDGTKQFFPAGTIPGSASEWIQYVPQEFKLPAFGKQKIDYTISVPDNIQGGHYGVLFFERSADPAEGHAAVKIVTRIGCLFFIEARDKTKNANLQDIKFESNDLTGTFVNNSNVVLIPQTTYYIMDEDGMVADRGEVAKLYVAPGAMASWKVPVLESLKSGRYTFFLNADLEEGDVVVKEITFQKDLSAGLVIEKVQD